MSAVVQTEFLAYGWRFLLRISSNKVSLSNPVESGFFVFEAMNDFE